MTPQAPPPSTGRSRDTEPRTAPISVGGPSGGRAARRSERSRSVTETAVDSDYRVEDLDEFDDLDEPGHGPGRRRGRAAGHEPGGADPLAIGALVAAILLPVVGIVLGAVALRRIGRTGAGGRTLALVAIVVGAVLTIALVVGAVLYTTSSGSTATPATPGATTSGSGGTPAATGPSLPARVVEQKILETGARSASCPGPLPAVVGATIECTAGLANGPAPLVAKVTGINGSDVAFDLTSR